MITLGVLALMGNFFSSFRGEVTDSEATGKIFGIVVVVVLSIIAISLVVSLIDGR